MLKTYMPVYFAMFLNNNGNIADESAILPPLDEF